MSGHIAGQPLECIVNKVMLQKEALLDLRGNHQTDEAGNPMYLCGFRIAGGIDQDNSRSPQGYPDKGVYVTHVTKGGAADRAGLRVHDKILQVNGCDMTLATHRKAVEQIVRRSLLEIFVHRPEEEDGRRMRRGGGGGGGSPYEGRENLSSLEMNVTKGSVEDSSSRFGNFMGDLSHSGNFPGPSQPQPMPRVHDQGGPSGRTGPRDGEGYDGRRGRQSESEQYRDRGSHQQRYAHPRGESQSHNWGGNQNSVAQGGPLKPPRWQQYTHPEQQSAHNQTRSVDSSRAFQYPPQSRSHTYGSQNPNQNSAFESHVSRPANDYRREAIQASRSNYSSSPNSDQRYRQVADSRNQNNSHTYLQQQRTHASDQQRFTGYAPEKRSTLPNNANLPNQNRFY